MTRMLLGGLLLLLLGFSTGCGGDDPAPPAGGSAASEKGTKNNARFPNVVKAKATAATGGAYDFAVTLSSPYDSPERYADGWRVETEAGKVLGEMKLGHDHATEQPFTRDQPGVRIAAGVDTVVIEGHDLKNGYGGTTASVKLPSP